MRGGVRGYAAQAILQIDAEIAEKGHFWMETSSNHHQVCTGRSLVKNDPKPGRPMKKPSAKLILSAIACVAIVIAVIYIARLAHKDFKETTVSQTQQELLTIAQATARGLEQFIAERSRALMVLSMDPAFQKQVYEKTRCEAPGTESCALRNLYKAHRKDVSALSLLDANGIMLHREPFIADRLGMDHTDKPGIRYVLREYKPHVSEVFHNNFGNLAISISEPIFYQEELAGLARWMIETDAVAKQFVEPIKVGKKGYAWMFDDKNVVLSHPRKSFIGMTVLDVIRKIHREKDEVLDEGTAERHMLEEHDYLNRVKAEEHGAGISVDCVTDEQNIVAFQGFSAGKLTLNLVVALPYSEIVGPVQKHARDTFALAGLVLLLLGFGGAFLLKSEKRKSELKAEKKHLEKIAESAAALKESKEQIQHIVNNLPYAIFQVDNDLNVVWANKMGTEMNSDGVGQPCYKAYARQDKPCEDCNSLAAMATRRVVSSTMHHLGVAGVDGESYWEKTAVPLYGNEGEVSGAIELSADVTERKRTEVALRESEERFREFVEGTDDLIARVDGEGRLLYVNSTAEKIFGLSPEECVGLSAFDFIHPDDRQRTEAAFAGWLRDRVTSTTFENRQMSRTGQVYHMHWTINLHFDENGNLIAINSIAKDVTDLKRAQEALAAETEGLNVTLRSIGDGVIATDVEGRIILVNRVAEKLTGWASGEAVNKPLGDVFHIVDEVTGERRENPVDRVIKTRDIVALANPTVLIAKDGTERILSDSAAPMVNSKGDIIGVVIVFRDITEKRKTEARLQGAQKMEAIATLAGGIAHEFNNALVGVSGNIELLQMDLPQDGKMDIYVRRMKNATSRMADLTHQLLAYARGGRYQPKTVSLNDFVESTLPLIKHSIDPAIRVETDLPRGISPVEVDFTQMQMVFSAVMHNSAEAMEGEGRIRVITRDEEINEETVEADPSLKPGSYVRLTIEDDGKGMDRETLSRVFEPFFSTKFQGRGMAMAAVYGIVKNHGGSISVDSELGKGTVVQIRLPAGEVQVEQPKETKGELTTGSGTILLIEDEEVVIEVIRPMLERMGWRILLAKTGMGAIDIARTFDGDIDLAILDIVLPDMVGSQVYPLIMEARPDLKVIVCSGYTLDGPGQEILDAGAQDFVEKPFSLGTLSEKLKRVLEGQ